jgi:hypothetical protein
MKKFILYDDRFRDFIINNEIAHRFWDSVVYKLFFFLSGRHAKGAKCTAECGTICPVYSVWKDVYMFLESWLAAEFVPIMFTTAFLFCLLLTKKILEI